MLTFALARLSCFWCDVIQSRWRPWRHFQQQSAATWWVAYAEATDSSWSIVYSLFRPH